MDFLGIFVLAIVFVLVGILFVSSIILIIGFVRKSRLLKILGSIPIFIIFLGFTVFGVWFWSQVPKKIQVSDIEVQKLYEAANQVDRTSLGFTSLPTNGITRIERRSRKAAQSVGYDVMLHFESDQSHGARTIAFQRTGENSFKWVHEQEIHDGPKMYSTVDGTFNESICLTYELRSVVSTHNNSLAISYSGEDPRLNKTDLTLADIQPILIEWKNSK